jgi:hypothetical protein
MSDPHGPQALFQQILHLTRRIEMLEALVLKQDTVLQAISPHSRPIHLSSEIRGSAPEYGPAEVAPPDPAWIPIYHEMQRPESGFPPPCHQVALYLTEPPQEGKNADLRLMRVRTPFQPEWKIPERGIDEPRCSSCWSLVDPFSNADLDYLSVMLPGSASPSSAPKRTPSARRKSGDVGRSADQRGSPDPAVVAGIPAPSTYPGHDINANLDIHQDIEALRKLAEDAGLR